MITIHVGQYDEDAGWEALPDPRLSEIQIVDLSHDLAAKAIASDFEIYTSSIILVNEIQLICKNDNSYLKHVSIIYQQSIPNAYPINVAMDRNGKTYSITGYLDELDRQLCELL